MQEIVIAGAAAHGDSSIVDRFRGRYTATQAFVYDPMNYTGRYPNLRCQIRTSRLCPMDTRPCVRTQKGDVACRVVGYLAENVHDSSSNSLSVPLSAVSLFLEAGKRMTAGQDPYDGAKEACEDKMPASAIQSIFVELTDRGSEIETTAAMFIRSLVHVCWDADDWPLLTGTTSPKIN